MISPRPSAAMFGQSDQTAHITLDSTLARESAHDVGQFDFEPDGLAVLPAALTEAELARIRELVASQPASREPDLLDRNPELAEVLLCSGLGYAVEHAVSADVRLLAGQLVTGGRSDPPSGGSDHHPAALRQEVGQSPTDPFCTVWISLAAQPEPVVQVIRGSHLWGRIFEEHNRRAAHSWDIDDGAVRTIHGSGDVIVVLHGDLVLRPPGSAPAAPLIKLVFERRVPHASPAGRVASPAELGGGRSAQLESGERTAFIEKRHLVVGRIMRDRAASVGRTLIDAGTDYHYPFYGDYTPTVAAMDSLAQHPDSLLHYPSSFGLAELRRAFSEFAARALGVELDDVKDVMVTTGASQAFDALSRSLVGTWVLLPDLSLPTVASVSAGNGARLLRVPLNRRTRLMDLDTLDRILANLADRGETVRFVYLNSPCNPNGAIATWDYLARLVTLARRWRALILHDMDVWFTTHTLTRAINILEIPHAAECAVTAISISKEFGLPGTRVGFVAGNRMIIDTLRAHNSLFCVMIPEVCQWVARAALMSFNPEHEKPDISARITKLLHRSYEGWRSLGWPVEAVHLPSAGFKYLLGVPPKIVPATGFSPVELFDFYVASRAYVKLSTSVSFNPENRSLIRMVVMQDEAGTDELFDRLRSSGVHYQMTIPPAVGREYRELVEAHMSGNF